MTLSYILLVFSFVLALCAGYPPANTRVNLFPLAFAFLVAAMLFGGTALPLHR